jgi:HPt (histidine-containing phosphotransfer) domain-containing protein
VRQSRLFGCLANALLGPSATPRNLAKTLIAPTELIETFERDAAGHLGALRTAIASGDTRRLREEAHELNGASCTVGAQVMSGICQQLENLGIAQNVEGAAELIERLEREFDRVQHQIEGRW